MSCEPCYSLAGIETTKRYILLRTLNVIVYHDVINVMELLVSLMFFYTSSVLIPSISATVVLLEERTFD